MKYYMDCEFLEGKQKEGFPINLFRKETPETIDLISIGIVAEDGREYYAISKDFNLKEAWNRYDVKKREYNEYHYENGDITYFTDKVNPEALEAEHKAKLKRSKFSKSFSQEEEYKDYWIRENVLKPIWKEYEHLGEPFTYKGLKAILSIYGKTNKQIAEEIKTFTLTNFIGLKREKSGNSTNRITKPEFYAYYGDYDWVVFCWLFGNMIDLPEGFPMYCKDLKQMVDTIEQVRSNKAKKEGIAEDLADIDKHPDYPKQTNEHNALEDARWNKKLHEFIKQL